MENWDLSSLPASATLHSVTADRAYIDGKPALQVTLTDAVHAGKPGVDYIDQPTFVVIPSDFKYGRIEVDIRSELLPDAPDYARGFIGIAYHINFPNSSDRTLPDTFESVYLRPTNGSNVAPKEGPRRLRAMQYYAYPEYPFDKLRDGYPEGTFEGPADIRPGQWHRLVMEVSEAEVKVEVDGRIVHAVKPLMEAEGGPIGLWVDVGTNGSFANLTVKHTN